jgi:hypothetical protein
MTRKINEGVVVHSLVDDFPYFSLQLYPTMPVSETIFILTVSNPRNFKYPIFDFQDPQVPNLKRNF